MTLIVLAAIGLLALVSIALVVKRLLYICGPNEVLIFPEEGGVQGRA